MPRRAHCLWVSVERWPRPGKSDSTGTPCRCEGRHTRQSPPKGALPGVSRKQPLGCFDRLPRRVLGVVIPRDFHVLDPPRVNLARRLSSLVVFLVAIPRLHKWLMGTRPVVVLLVGVVCFGQACSSSTVRNVRLIRGPTIRWVFGNWCCQACCIGPRITRTSPWCNSTDTVSRDPSFGRRWKR